MVKSDKVNENKDDQLTYSTVSRGEKNDGIIDVYKRQGPYLLTQKTKKVFADLVNEENDGDSLLG